MTHSHSQNDILAHLQRQSVGILGTTDPVSGFVRQRVMFFGIDDLFRCYLMSTKESPKIGQILASGSVSFIVFGIEQPYDRTWEAECGGRAELLTREEDIREALDRLRGRNPFADVALESGISRRFDILRLRPAVIRFRVYGEALEGVQPTVLELDD